MLGRWAAVAIGCFGLISAIVISLPSMPALKLARLLIYLAIGIFGALLRPARPWAVWMLFTFLIFSFALSAVTGNLYNGIIPRALAVGVCVRGALSVFQHDIITRRIVAATSENAKVKVVDQTK